MSDTPRVDAFTTSLYNQACAAAAEGAAPGISGHDCSPEEAYGLAVDLAQTLERELTAAQGELRAAADHHRAHHAAEQAPRVEDSADAQADRHYALGARFGWNCGVTGDREKFDSAMASREQALRDAPAVSALVVPSATVDLVRQMRDMANRFDPKDTHDRYTNRGAATLLREAAALLIGESEEDRK